MVSFVVLLCACSQELSPVATNDGGTAGQRRDGAAEVDDCRAFWKHLEIDGNWAEYFPTLRELAEGSDGVAYGRFVSARMGATIQGDAPEDSYTEIVLSVADDAELLHGTMTGALTLTLTPGAGDVTASTLSGCIPDASVLVFARKRMDQDTYRPVNGYGIWAATPRAALDTPLEPVPPEDGLYGEEISRYQRLSELTDAVRRYLSQ